MRNARPQTARGFTLLELLVVSVLMLVTVMLTAQVWRQFRLQMADLTARARSVQELRLVLESLAGDMGAVVWATPLDDGSLVICRRPVPGQDDVLIRYSLDQQRLMRCDQSTGVTVPVASDMAGFAAQNLTESVLRIAVTVTSGNTTRQASLLWSRP